MSNEVDVSPERIASEFAAVRADALALYPVSSEPEPGTASSTEYSDGQPRPDIGVGVDGFDIPDIPTGNLCCFAGALAVDRLAPGWRVAGLTNEHIEGVGQPLGAVIDKYVDRYFPGSRLSEVLDPWKAELALAFGVVSAAAVVRGVPRHLTQEQYDNIKQQQGEQHGNAS